MLYKDCRYYQDLCLLAKSLTMETRPALNFFDISSKTGFLPESPPLTALPSVFNDWNEVFSQLSDLLRKHKLRDAVHRLPEFHEQHLCTKEEWRAALILLSGLFQGYLWQDGEKGLPTKMPSVLSVPFVKVSKQIGTPPVGNYASTVLYNWRLRDPRKEMSLENLQAIVNHTGTEDESWFFMVHVVIELEAVPAVEAIWEGLGGMDKEDNVVLSHCLKKIESALINMMQALNRMSERCEPKTFYVSIRPYVAGTKDLDAFPEGILYEGVDSKPLAYNGASAAQSTPLRAFDCFLGIDHDGKELEFLEEMRKYMPEKHRKFLEYLSIQRSLRQYIVQSQDKDLITQYNSTIETFVEFRDAHIVVVTRFIVNQKQHTVNPSLEEIGTGGTPFMHFLKNVRDNTKNSKILN